MSEKDSPSQFLFHFYKIQIIQSLNSDDFQQQIRFCEEAQRKWLLNE